MATQNPSFVKVYDSLTATGSDVIANAGGVVSIKNGNSTPQVLKKFLTSNAISGAKKTVGLAARGKSVIDTIATAVVGTEFSFTISQRVPEPGGDGLVQVQISYIAATGDSVDSIAASLVNLINRHESLKVTASSPTADDVQILADSAAPLFTISDEITVTFTENTGVDDVATATGVASASDQTTITVGAGEADKFQAGDTVTLATFSTNNGDYVVASAAGASIVIFNNGTAPTGTGSVTYKSQAPINVGADLTVDGVAENLTYADGTDPVAIGAAKVYTKCEFHFYDVKGVGGFNQASGNQRFVLDMYIDQSITAANYKASVDAIDVVIAALPA